MIEPVIRAEGLHKSFGSMEVVRGIDLRVPPGTCFGLLGPNGAGKTTTIRMIMGQSPHDGGSLHVFGKAMPASARSVRRRTGVVPQADNLDPDFTVAENLRFYGGYFGLPRDTLDDRIGRLLEFVALTERADSRIDTLSGGMKRRLIIARALVNDPELVVLDEPTTGLDPQVRHMIWARLRALKQSGKTLLLTTHYMEEAQRLCDELVITFLASGIVASSAMNTASFEGMYSVYTRMVPQRTYDSMLATPIDVDDIIAGEMLWCATKSTIASTAILLVASLLGAIHHPRAVLAVPAAFLIGLCFAGPAIVMSAFSRSYDFFSYYFTLVITPMSMLCGVFYPVSSLPGWLQNAVQVLPLTHAVGLVRPLVAGQEPGQPVLHILVLLVYALVCYYLAVILVRKRLIV